MERPSITPATFAAWQALAESELGDRPIADLHHDYGGIDIRPAYFAGDAQSDPGMPGAAPFTRGVRATMYGHRPWTIRQYMGFSTAAESNAFYRKALDGGQRGLSVAFDLATHRGYDSDHERAAGDVGMAGVAIDSIDDMKALFDGIPLDRISVSMTMNGAVVPVLAMFIAAAEEAGLDRSVLSGTIQNDILKEFMVRNTYIYPPEPSMRIVADIIAFAADEMPKFNSVSISGYHIHEAGATAVQELAYTLADGMEYVRAALARGLDIDAFAGRLSFFFGIGMNFFLEVAKLRAARTLWAGIMTDFSATTERSKLLRTHCQTSGVSLTEQDPHNNIVRTAYEALAAVLGGTQSLHTNSFDEAIALPSEASARVARSTQLILQHESRVTDVVDPLGGSYYVEALTNDLAAAAGALIAEIEETGGMTQAVQAGTPKLAIERTAARRQAAIDKGETVIVGVNRFRPEGGAEVDTLEIDNRKVGAAQISRLKRLKASRDSSALEKALRGLREAAASSEKNLLAAAIPCARARATLGEISAALEDVFGRYLASTQIISGVFGEAYGSDPEYAAFQRRLGGYGDRRGRAPAIYIAKMGQDGHDRGARIIATAFADMGFQVHVGDLFETPAETLERALEAGVDVIGVSSLAAAHKTLVPELTGQLKARDRADILVFCGGVIPERDHAMLREAGVADIFGPATNVLDAANTILSRLEGRQLNR